MEIDLADRLDDLICTFDKAVSDGPSDIVVAILGWFVFAGGFCLAIGYIVHNLRSSISIDIQDAAPVVHLTDNTSEIKAETEIGAYNGHAIASDTDHQAIATSSDNTSLTTRISSLEIDLANTSEPTDDAHKPKPSFVALDPPIFPTPTEQTNEHMVSSNHVNKSVEKEVPVDSDPMLNGLLNGKDSIINDV